MDTLALKIRGDLSYKSSMYKDSANTRILKENGTTLINLSAKLSHINSGWHMIAGGTNITNRKYITSGLLSGGGGYTSATFSRGAEWYLSLGYEF